MDRVRSCYQTNMRFYDDPTLLVKVQYYFVPEGTPMVPYPTPFVSSNWDAEQLGYGGKGEVWPPKRTWANGAKVGDAVAVEGQVCGDAAEWHYGLPAPPAVPVPLDPFGTPLCCQRSGGPYPGPLCPNCPGQSWSEYRLTLSGVTDNSCNCSGLNGTFTLAHSAPCEWTGGGSITCPAVVPITMRLSNLGGGLVELLVFNVAAGLAVTYLTHGGWDCLSPLTLTMTSQSGHSCHWPVLATIHPPL